MKVILIVLILLCLCSCALLNKTNKTTTTDKQSSEKQLESSQLILKKADKETQVFTFWNDSGVYQYQYVKERIDQAKMSKLQSEENQQVKQTIATKETEPGKVWIYIVLLMGLMGGYLIFKGYRFFRH